MVPLCSLKDLRWRRGDFTLAIDALELAPARLYALCGANGAGKSSLLRLLALLERAQSGEYRICGELAGRGNWLRLRRHLTLVEQEPWLLRGTVAENLAYGLARRGIGGEERSMRIATALAAVGLEGFAGRPAQSLSVGEGRRVALARGLALKPRLLLFDEPTAGLDRGSRVRIEALLPELVAAGMTVVVATHEGRTLERLGAETIRLARGQIAEPARAS